MPKSPYRKKGHAKKGADVIPRVGSSYDALNVEELQSLAGMLGITLPSDAKKAMIIKLIETREAQGGHMLYSHDAPAPPDVVIRTPSADIKSVFAASGDTVDVQCVPDMIVRDFITYITPGAALYELCPPAYVSCTEVAAIEQINTDAQKRLWHRRVANYKSYSDTRLGLNFVKAWTCDSSVTRLNSAGEVGIVRAGIPNGYKLFTLAEYVFSGGASLSTFVYKIFNWLTDWSWSSAEDRFISKSGLSKLLRGIANTGKVPTRIYPGNIGVVVHPDTYSAYTVLIPLTTSVATINNSQAAAWVKSTMRALWMDIVAAIDVMSAGVATYRPKRVSFLAKLGLFSIGTVMGVASAWAYFKYRDDVSAMYQRAKDYVTSYVDLKKDGETIKKAQAKLAVTTQRLKENIEEVKVVKQLVEEKTSELASTTETPAGVVQLEEQPETVRTLKKQVADLTELQKETAARMKFEMAEAKKLQIAVYKENKDAHQYVDKLRDELKECKSTTANYPILHAKYEQIKLQLEQSEQWAKDLNLETGKRQAELDAVSAKLAAASAKLAEVELKIAQVPVIVEIPRSPRANMNDVSDIQIERETANAELASLKLRQKQADDNLAATLDEYNKANSVLAKAISDGETTKIAMALEVTTLTDKIAALKKELATYDENTAKHTKLKAEIATSQANLDAIKSQADEYNLKKAALDAKTVAVAEPNIDLINQRNTLLKQIKDLETIASAKLTEGDLLKSQSDEVVAINNKLSLARAELDTAAKQLNQLRVDKDTLLKEIGGGGGVASWWPWGGAKEDTGLIGRKNQLISDITTAEIKYKEIQSDIEDMTIDRSKLSSAITADVVDLLEGPAKDAIMKVRTELAEITSELQLKYAARDNLEKTMSGGHWYQPKGLIEQKADLEATMNRMYKELSAAQLRVAELQKQEKALTASGVDVSQLKSELVEATDKLNTITTERNMYIESYELCVKNANKESSAQTPIVMQAETIVIENYKEHVETKLTQSVNKPAEVKPLLEAVQKATAKLENNEKLLAPSQGPPGTPTVPRIHIIALSAGDKRRVSFADLTTNQQNYAKKHGYEYVQFTESLAPCRPEEWSKIKALEQKMDVATSVGIENDWYMWVDDDVVFTNPNMKIESIIGQHMGKDLILSADPASHSDIYPFNNGVFLIRNTEWSRDFLKKVYAIGGEQVRLTTRGVTCLEQEAMKILLCNERTGTLLSESTSHVVILPNTDPNKLQSFLRCIKSNDDPNSVWKPNNFAAHLTGLLPVDRSSIITRLFAKSQDKLHGLDAEALVPLSCNPAPPGSFTPPLSCMFKWA